MIPDSFAAFYAFLGLVAPGLVFQLLRERRRPVLEQTTFREASNVALSSLVFTSLSSGLLVAVAACQPAWLVDASQWIGQPAEYSATNLGLVAATVVWEVLIACALAALAQWVVAVRARDGRVIATSLWYHKFKTGLPKGMATWVQVQLQDGTRFWGYVEHFTTEHALADRELSLVGPGLAIKSPMKNRSQLGDFDSVALRGDQIVSIRVKHKPAAADVVAAPRWWQVRRRASG